MEIRLSISVLCLLSIAILVPVLVSQSGADAEAIKKLENDSVKASLANDSSWYKQNTTNNFMEGTSFGAWLTRDQDIKDADNRDNKVNSMSISDMKVTSYGSAAIARYSNSYDDVLNGQHRHRTVICTDTFVKQGGTWKEAASHCSEKGKQSL